MDDIRVQVDEETHIEERQSNCSNGLQIDDETHTEETQNNFTNCIQIEDETHTEETQNNFTNCIQIEDETDTEETQKNCAKAYKYLVLPCIAEFLGSCIFIFIGCASVIGNTTLTGSLQPALAHGLALSCSIAFSADNGGGHLNPAVTLGVMVLGGIDYRVVVPFWIAQLLGGVTGAALTKLVFPQSQFDSAFGAAFTAMQSDGNLCSIIVAEIVMTAFLVITVCSKSPQSPFTIGLVVTASCLGCGGISGGCMNPARAFGPAVVANYWSYHWIYWVGPMSGALLVGVVLRCLRILDQ